MKNSRIVLFHDRTGIKTSLLTVNGDLLVIDLFAGAHVPLDVINREFYQEAARYLKPHGMVAVNIADGPGLLYAGEKATALASIFRRSLLSWMQRFLG